MRAKSGLKAVRTAMPKLPSEAMNNHPGIWTWPKASTSTVFQPRTALPISRTSSTPVAVMAPLTVMVSPPEMGPGRHGETSSGAGGGG